jgi:NAD(P)-dependent dehydrogenase (short-subunit alcohol dehydrogenase family)
LGLQAYFYKFLKLKQDLSMKKFIILFILFALPAEAKTILVTNSYSGLGTAVCQELIKENHQLIISGRNQSKLDALKHKLNAKNISTLLFDYDNIHSIELATSKIDNIDGLVIIPPRPEIDSTIIPDAKKWEKVIYTSFITPLEFVKQLQNKFSANGSIVIISGVTSAYFMESYANTNVIRMMWLAEVKNLTYQLGKKNIRVNSVLPGMILTDYNIKKITKRAATNHKPYDLQLAEESASTPLSKYGQPQDVAQAIEFLLSDKANHISGASLVIDGGRNLGY